MYELYASGCRKLQDAALQIERGSRRALRQGARGQGRLAEAERGSGAAARAVVP
jgi:hypothetical protein